MKIITLQWHTKPRDDSTHVVDDGGMIYWCHSPELSGGEVAQSFRRDYDGKVGNFEVTDLRTNETTEY